METGHKSTVKLIEKRQLVAQRLDDWRERNASRLKGWDPVAVLREWREKRWSSSTHQ